MIKIAILGATSHIAKNLIYHMYANLNWEFYLFNRNQHNLERFLMKLPAKERISFANYCDFTNYKFDVLINCVGIGDPGKLSENYYEVFKITEQFDNLCCEYLSNHPKTLYINLSSGAVYLNDFKEPASLNTEAVIKVNHINISEFYGIAKLNSEAKHRSLSNYKIVDLRIFGFFSRFIDLQSQFFMTDVIKAIINKEVLETSSSNIIRDYVHPIDFVRLIEIVINSDKILNAAFDVYSVEPISKMDILDFFVRKYGLKYYTNEKFSVSATGNKSNYYTCNKEISKLGYQPHYSTLQTIQNELLHILA
ncbi:NAD-dependent epimerase/dehydratase family protein [Paenibacillus oryzisoli]|uniref:NAD-dependent epimerase/dehydratase family protein n=1 Tax=Paenibacillus oryzisoli TaxID=1850517 RepID=UPI003D2888D7